MQNHHQALLVILSYIIGFTTAFILFALTDGGNSKATYSEVVTSDDPAMMVEEEQPTVVVNEEGLFVTVEGEDRIISAATSAEVAEVGFHVDVKDSTLSPDGRFVSYCVQMAVATEDCQYFLYSIADNKTYMLKHEDESMVLKGDEVSGPKWTMDSELSLDGKVASMGSMWILR